MSGTTDPGAAVDAVARYLATGDMSGVADAGQRGRLTRARTLLADGCTWVEPSPGLRDAIVDRILQVARSDPLRPPSPEPAPPAAAPGHPEGSGEADGGGGRGSGRGGGSAYEPEVRGT